MNDLQQRVAVFARHHRLETDVPHRLLDAVSELGEVAKEALRGSGYGRRRFQAGPEWSDELGDVFFSLLCVANTTGVDVASAVNAALDKYERRLKRSGTAGSRAATPRRTRPAR